MENFFNILHLFIIGLFFVGIAFAQTNPHRELTLDCNACHTTSSWSEIHFNHSKTGFMLSGVHTKVACGSCHVIENFSKVSATCISCHKDVHQGKLGPACSNCHKSSGWSVIDKLSIHMNTTFPLTGVHLQLDCNACHIGEIENEFSFLNPDCYSCHQTSYLQVKDPDHVANNFSTDCTICHNTSAWLPAFFSHNNTRFPLTGAHVKLLCQACHQSGYTGLPTDCFSCHQQDYLNTNNPDHQAAGFPADCEQCHTTNAWDQTTWDHDSQYFPIYSGKHRGKWSLCTDCHVVQNNFTLFECINCHEHERTKMDDKHRDIQGYVYLSSACYDCHPTGDE